MKIPGNKKAIVIAVLVIVFGIVLIGGLKHFGKKVVNISTTRYVCATTVDGQTTSIDITYKGNKPSVLKYLWTINGEKEFNEDGSKNESPERQSYESQANTMAILLNTYEDIDGVSIEAKEEDGIATGEMLIDYSLLADDEINGLIAKRDEPLKKYIERLGEKKYSCEKQ